MEGADPTTTLKRDALGRVALPRQKREALLDEFERGSLSGTQFARVAGINYQTFAGWMQQRRRARGDYAPRQHRADAPAAVRLVEAVFTTGAAAQPALPEPATASTLTLEVLLPGGARLLVGNAHQAALAAQLLKALVASC
jgi:hypothetical protein